MGIAQRIKELRESAHLTQQELAKKISISRSTLAGYESENKQPSYQVLTQLASVFKVPTDYLLGVGVFENWNVLLENKTMVLHQISIQAQQLALNIKNGVDDITFAKLVYAFDIRITTNEDGEIGISGKDPIPTYAENYFANTVNVNDNEKRILSLYRLSNDDDKKNILDLLNSFCSLQERKNKIKVLGRCFDLEESESVAADKPIKMAK